MKKRATFIAELMRALVDMIAAIVGVYYSRKYAAIVHRLGLPNVAPSRQRGFIIIQIDGLAYTYLQSSQAQGYVPFLQRMIRNKAFMARPWNSGIPCTTPAVQAGIMFGHSDDIPGFRWYEKETGLSPECTVPSTVSAIQNRIAQDRHGLLTDGSSILNMYDGGATRSVYTLGTLQHMPFFEGVKGLGFLIIFALNPLRFMKTLILAAWEYLTDLFQRASAQIRRRTPRPLSHLSSFLRVMSNVVLREMQTFAVMVDIYRGVPAIYTTYYGYDEVAHHYGMLSKPALRALRSIDGRIHQIDTLRRMALSREYDLYILSDHGMTAAVPFQWTYGQTLGEYVQELIGQSVGLDESDPTRPPNIMFARYLSEELEAIAPNLSHPLAVITNKLRELVIAKTGLRRELPADLDLSRRNQVVVRNSGPMSHVYFDISTQPLDLSQILQLFPELVSGLLTHPGIGLLAARENDQVMVMSRAGVLTLNEDSAYELEGQNPLGVYRFPLEVAREIRRLMGFHHTGDLVLFGAYDPEHDHVGCFEEMWACHGGLGGPQRQAFLITESHINWQGKWINEPADLYHLFTSKYSKNELDVEKKDKYDKKQDRSGMGGDAQGGR